MTPEVDRSQLALRKPAPVDPAVLAAIVAAVDQSWPRPGLAGSDPDAPAAWRFSGRWWHKPLPLRRDRPW